MIVELINFVVANVTTSLLVSIALLYVVRHFSDVNRGKHLPPGPWNIPIVGQIPFLAANFDGFTNKMVKKYGHIYRMRLGSREMIILNGYKAIKEALITHGEVFSGRDRETYGLVNYFFDFRGILMEDGQIQKEQRRFALSAFRDFGVGRPTVEEKIHRETERFTANVNATKGEPFDIRHHLDNATANVISAIAMDTNFSYDDPDFKELRDLTIECNRFQETKMVVFLPWIRHISKELSGFNTFNQTKAEYTELLQKRIIEHKATLDENNPRDYLDCHLAEYNKRQKSGLPVTPFDEGRLQTNLSLFCVGGMLTTSSTLNWAFKHLLVRPDLQKVLHDEIDLVIGSSRLPRYSDRGQMPQTEAYLCEVQRMADILPFSFPHTNMEEIKLFGYDIPKRSLIFPNLRSVHQDPDLWVDPQNFRPARFINDQGKCERPEYLIPFSLGKRACMGENLARMELFLIFVTMLQRFTFSSPAGAVNEVTLDPGMSRSISPYEMCAHPRS